MIEKKEGPAPDIDIFGRPNSLNLFFISFNSSKTKNADFSSPLNNDSVILIFDFILFHHL